MKRTRHLLSCILCVILVAGILNICPDTEVYAAKSETESQLDEAKEAYEETQDRIEETSENIDDLTDRHDSLQETLDDLNSKLSEAGEILERLEENINSKKTEIDLTWGRIEELATQIDALESMADEQYQLVKAQIKYAYESGDTMYMALLRGGGTYADYLNRSSYMEMFAEYNQNMIDSLMNTSSTLRQTQEEYENELVRLEEEKAELDEYEQTVKDQQEQIRISVEETSEKVSDYADEIDAAEARLKQYEKELAEKEDDIETLTAKLEEEKKMTAQAQASEWRDISGITYSGDDRKLLANLIWCEAGNEPYVGQVAVGAVVMNRIMSSVFPDTMVGVIYQKKQFSPASSGRLALALSLDSATEDCYRAADAAMSGVNNIGSCLYFRTPTSAVSPKYVIGGHYFY